MDYQEKQIMNKAKEEGKRQEKDAMKNAVKKAIMTMIKGVLMSLLKYFMIAIVLSTILGAIIDFIAPDLEWDSGKVYASDMITIVGGKDGDFVVHTDKSSSSLVINDVETLKKAFGGYPTNSKLLENVELYLEYQNTYKVNAVFAAAISIKETTAGTQGNATNGKNNWYNIICTHSGKTHGTFETYASAQESIEAFYKLMTSDKEGYFAAGKYTVSEIGNVYCPNTSDYPTQCEDWINSVIGFMTQMYEAAGITIDGGGTSSSQGGGTSSSQSSHNYIIGTFTSSITNKTFYIYNQNVRPNWGDRCNRAATISLCSGYYANNEQDALELMDIADQGSWNSVGTDDFFKTYTGGALTKKTNLNDKKANNPSEIRTALQSGKYVLLYLKGSKAGYDGIRFEWKRLGRFNALGSHIRL